MAKKKRANTNPDGSVDSVEPTSNPDVVEPANGDGPPPDGPPPDEPARDRDGFGYVVPDFGTLWVPNLEPLACGFGVAVCRLTPELAAMFLDRLAENQRGYAPRTGDKYVEDIRSGLWRLTHQGMAFDRDGFFVDGQHRCRAVIAAGRPIDTLVFFGVGGKEEMAAYDMGRNRTLGDATRVMGVDWHSFDTKVLRSWLREGNGDYTPRSHGKIMEYGRTLYRELLKLRSWFGPPRSQAARLATVRSAVLSAMIYGVDERVLERFVGVLTDQIADAGRPGDSSALFLRRWLNAGEASGVRTSDFDRDVFLRTTYAILMAEEGAEVKRCNRASTNPYRATLAKVDPPADTGDEETT